MRVVFRVDASIQIGSGHVMRCLTLADELRLQGAECIFVCRAHEGHMLKTVLQKGYAVRELSAPATEWCQKVNSDYVLSHAHWLGVTSQSDVADTQQALQGEGLIDWLVVDHYALDAKWEQAMQAMSRNLMVIDDLADRQHYCDLLLDQNLGRTEQDYASLMSKQAKLLIGPSFALLRHEFATARYDSLVRRQQPALTHLLVSMGGVDKDNLTGRVLDALAQSGMQPGFKITVVMGEHAPWLAAVREQAGSMPCPTQVLINVQNMAELMVLSDLAIGAAGGTAWERCCLGLPTCVFVLADNQREGAKALQHVGAVCLMQDCSEVVPFLRQLFDQNESAALQKMSRAAAAVTDGQGAARVTSHLMDLAYA